MSKEFEINGCIEVPDEMDIDRLWDEFIQWIESKGWYFGGGFRELTEEILKSEAFGE